jgi:hypothetical protein
MMIRIFVLTVFCAATGFRAQAVVDPFRGVTVQDDGSRGARVLGTVAERSSVRGLELSNKGMPLWVTTRAIGATSVVFVRGWASTGTGFGQVGFYLFRAWGSDSVRLLWSGIAEERSTPWRGDSAHVQPRYHLRFCLYQVGDRIVYVSADYPKNRQEGGFPRPRSGFYELGRDSLVWKASPSEAAVRQCASAATLIP